MTTDPVEVNVVRKPKYKRIVLKISGEALKGEGMRDIIDGNILQFIAEEIKKVHDFNVQIGLVVGGGNVFRGQWGATSRGVDRTTGDYMGMLGTTINGLALMDCLEKNGVPVRIQSAIPMDKVAEPFIPRRAVRHMEKGRVVIFVAGTGNPYFSTDTTAALRANEIDADVIMKATKVDGVYDKDPIRYPEAVRYDQLTFFDALQGRLNVMDSTAFSMCMDNDRPILVFSMAETNSILKAALGETIGTRVQNKFDETEDAGFGAVESP